MSTNNIKYLKDEEGNKISPVVGTKSVYTGGGSSLDTILSSVYTTELLFNGSTSGDITLTKSIEDFEMIRMDGYTNYHERGTLCKFFTVPEIKIDNKITFAEVGYVGGVYVYFLGAAFIFDGNKTLKIQYNRSMSTEGKNDGGTITFKRVVGYKQIT